MSWIGDIFAGTKRIIQLDADVARMEKTIERIETDIRNHERRLVRIETLIEISRTAVQLPPH